MIVSHFKILTAGLRDSSFERYLKGVFKKKKNKGGQWALLSSPLITFMARFCNLRISHKFVSVVQPQQKAQYHMRDSNSEK